MLHLTSSRGRRGEAGPGIRGGKADILNQFDNHGREVLLLAAKDFKDEDYLYLMSTKPETNFGGLFISGIATIVFGVLLVHQLLT